MRVPEHERYFAVARDAARGPPAHARPLSAPANVSTTSQQQLDRFLRRAHSLSLDLALARPSPELPLGGSELRQRCTCAI